MSSGRVFRFAPTPEHPAKHLFVFLHGCGATAQSMIPIAFKFQARFPSAALVVPSGFNPEARGGVAQDWYPTRGLHADNHRARVAAVLAGLSSIACGAWSGAARPRTSTRPPPTASTGDLRSAEVVPTCRE